MGAHSQLTERRVVDQDSGIPEHSGYTDLAEGIERSLIP